MSSQDKNPLYPIFLKASQLHFVIFGGGFVAEEKLHFLLKSSPDAKVTMVSPMFRSGTIALANTANVLHINDVYKPEYLDAANIVIATTDQPQVNEEIYADCRERNILVNVADNPPLCDFYMGGIVTKGNVKIGISTNGKSPTMAKRLRQFFEDVLPEEINTLAENLYEYRKNIKGDFEWKVNHMNEVTKDLIENKVEASQDEN